MATSGSVGTSGTDNSSFYLNWQQASQSVANNTTTINWQIGANLGHNYYSNAVSMGGTVINGVTVHGGGTWSNLNKGTHQLASGSLTIGHNADGTKSFSVSISGWVYGGDWVGGSGSFSLNTIPRYANVTSWSISKVTPNSLDVTFKTDRSTKMYAKLNNGEWLNGGNPFMSNVTSGTFTINYADKQGTVRLTPNTAYKVSILSRNASVTSVNLDKTYDKNTNTEDIARFIQAQNWNIGETNRAEFDAVKTDSTMTIALEQTDTEGGTFIREISPEHDVSDTTEYEYDLDANTLYSTIPNSNIGYVDYVLRTTCNGQTYEERVSRRYNVINSNPTLSMFLFKIMDQGTIDIMGTRDDWQQYSRIDDQSKFIQGKTRLSFRLQGTTKNSATIKQYRVSIGNTIFYGTTTSGIVEIPMNDNTLQNSNTITGMIVDSRDNVGKLSFTYVINPYNVPTVNVTTLKRQPKSVLDPNADKYLILNGEVKIPVYMISSSAQESYKVWYKWKESTSSTYTNYLTAVTPTSIEGDTLKFENVLLPTAFDTSKQYNVIIMGSDYYTKSPNGSQSIIQNISVSSPILSKRNGRIGIMKVPERGTLDVNGLIYSNEGIISDGYIKSGTNAEIGTFIRFTNKYSSSNNSCTIQFKRSDGTYDILKVVDGEVFLNGDELLVFEEVDSW